MLIVGVAFLSARGLTQPEENSIEALIKSNERSDTRNAKS
jgi:hypothetical protein